jgi:hypothetical protein
MKILKKGGVVEKRGRRKRNPCRMRLWEYHMPCEVVLLRVDFFKMVAVAMETVKMLKN